MKQVFIFPKDEWDKSIKMIGGLWRKPIGNGQFKAYTTYKDAIEDKNPWDNNPEYRSDNISNDYDKLTTYSI